MNGKKEIKNTNFLKLTNKEVFLDHEEKGSVKDMKKRGSQAFFCKTLYANGWTVEM